MIQLCLRWKITDCSANEALAEAMSFMPNQAAKALAAMNGTQMKPAFCSHSGTSLPASLTITRLAAEPAEHAGRDDERHRELHDADAEVAEAGIERQRVALLGLGEEEGDVGHRGGEVAAAEAAQQGERQEQPVGRRRVLHGHADAERRE